VGVGVAVAFVVIATVAAGCVTDRDGSEPQRTCDDAVPVDVDEVSVVATVAPITNIVSVIAAGSDVRVEGVVPEGVDSHTYEPTTSVAVALEQADVVFLNGLELEARTKELAVANSDGSVVCELGDHVLPESEYIFDFSFPESAGSPNPHLWTNPLMAADYATVVRDVLSAVAPDDADVFESNHDEFVARIDTLDRAVRVASDTLAPEDRLLLTYHDAYAYFAGEYGWTVVGAVQPASFDEPTPREVAQLVEQIRERGVAVIFGSEVFPSPVLRQIASETGVTYVDELRDDDLPGRPGDPEHSWFGLMTFNLVTIVEALGGDAEAIATIDTSPSAPDAAVYPQE